MSDASKKVDAWMPLWIGAYLADTMRLTTLQHGAYLLLLMAYWRERAALPDDDEELRSITKTDKAEWKKLRPVMAKFFTVVDGVWRHKRVEQELSSADARQKSAASKAKAAALARWGHGAEQSQGSDSSNAPGMLQALPEHMHDDCPTPSPSPSGIHTGLDNSKTSVCVEAHTPFSEKYQAEIAGRPELDAATVWANFNDHYPDKKRTLTKWRQWVKNEIAGKAPVEPASPAVDAAELTRQRLAESNKGVAPPSPERRKALAEQAAKFKARSAGQGGAGA